MNLSQFRKILFITFGCILPYTFSYSQSKLPNKQLTGVWIQANTKIDGKAIEWANKFLTYNRNTEAFITMANSNEQLYIIIQVNNPEIIKKIVDGGVTFTIKNARNVKNNISITYPITQTKWPLNYFLGAMDDKTAEAEIKTTNKLFKENHKFIKVTGVRGMGPLISVYNENGIQAAELLDNKQAFTLEMAVNIKQIGLSLSNETKLSYQLKFNGTRNAEPMAEDAKVALAGGGGEITGDLQKKIAAEMMEKFAKRGAATYFDGEYTLAKKP